MYLGHASICSPRLGLPLAQSVFRRGTVTAGKNPQGKWFSRLVQLPNCSCVCVCWGGSFLPSHPSPHAAPPALFVSVALKRDTDQPEFPLQKPCFVACSSTWSLLPLLTLPPSGTRSAFSAQPPPPAQIQSSTCPCVTTLSPPPRAGWGLVCLPDPSPRAELPQDQAVYLLAQALSPNTAWK